MIQVRAARALIAKGLPFTADENSIHRDRRKKQADGNTTMAGRRPCNKL